MARGRRPRERGEPLPVWRLVVQLDEGVRVARGAAREGRALLLGRGDVLRLPVAAAVERERSARLLADLLVRVRARVGVGVR